ncbi:SEL1-like repeat protein [Chlorobaculum limnaeum]|uniref:SEL1-like repeat protein n=1 Tax=Chlorobaculum limnaeum TaxID=274537 RepID=UPI000A572EA5|nr:SEL1-like repeat protein [Chlorobaculum limnaeum]
MKRSFIGLLAAILVMQPARARGENGSTENIARLQRAARQGDAIAQNKLGLLYHTGQGVKQDYAEALRWYRQAAGQGRA